MVSGSCHCRRGDSVCQARVTAQTLAVGPDLAVLSVFWEVEGPGGGARELVLARDWKSLASPDPTVPSSLVGGAADHTSIS